MRRFKQVDVFTAQPFLGNPVAVVLDGEGLDRVFAPSGERDCALHVRSFAPGSGVPEDPVGGSGNISVAAYLRHFGREQSAYVARQGMQLGRDGRIHMRIEREAIWLGGEAVTCVEGTLAA